MDNIIEQALLEDIGSGDITAQLIAVDKTLQASIITREAAVICGVQQVNTIFHALDPQIELTWLVAEGEQVKPLQSLLRVQGSARAILTAERTALNFLQLLSATATRTRQYVDKIAHTKAQVLDTRKTIPGLRELQKYAVHCGGGVNHRVGLYDAFLIKENHILACGSIANAVTRAKALAPDKRVEVEVENIAEYQQALATECDMIMLDNFSLDDMATAVAMPHGNIVLEASGGITLETITRVAETGVDYISVGELTKHINAIDLSLRVND